jgi:hypothetical protein
MRWLVLFFLVGIAYGGMPSDEIIHLPAPDVVDLSHVDPTIPKLFAWQDINLSMFRLRELPNLGHYCAWADTETQTEAVLTDSQRAVISVVNNTKNKTNSTDGLVYL